MVLSRVRVNRGRINRESGLTLLEVLIAVSIFALIGVASFRVLTSVIATQQIGDQHSSQLALFQKALFVIDRDMQQPVNRAIRVGDKTGQLGLSVKSGDYPLEFTHGGWQNPLMLPRSSLQRVAYDIGPHPKSNNNDSPFYGDERPYLRRIFWSVLDRDSLTEPQIQALLPDILELQIAVISDQGRHNQWPLPSLTATEDPPQIKALEFSFVSAELGLITRLYNFEVFGH